MVTTSARTQDRWWIFLLWGLISESWSMVQSELLCCKCSNKGMSLVAYKASLTSRHLRKIRFFTLPWRREEVAAGFQLYSLVSVISISDYGTETVVLFWFRSAAYFANSHVMFFHPKSEFWVSDELHWWLAGLWIYVQRSNRLPQSSFWVPSWLWVSGFHGLCNPVKKNV